jgi:hypothetical protein
MGIREPVVLTVDGLRGLVIALLSYVVSRARCCRRYRTTGRSHLTEIIFVDFFADCVGCGS